MEPEFIREQVRNVWRVVAANAKLIKDKEITVDGAFVGVDFVLAQAAILHDAVTDSVNLQAAHGREHQFVIMKPEFLRQQGKALQTVMEDSARLQDTSKTTHSELSSLAAAFIMGLVGNLRDVVKDNASVAMTHQVQQNSLYMSNPSFVARITTALHCVLNSCVLQRQGVILLRDGRLAAERAMAEAKAQTDTATAEKAAALSRLAELEASLAALQQECEQLKTAGKEAADIAQSRIYKLEEELATVSSEHMMCGSTLGRSDAELSTLKEEHKVLVQAHEERREAAMKTVRQLEALTGEKHLLELERDRLSAELSQLQKAHESFMLTRAQEHERMKAEITRLEGALAQSESATKSLTEERSQLKAALDAAKHELLQANNQLSASVIQCDTWKVTLDDVVSQQATDMEDVRQNAAREQENANNQLQDAAKRIEELESQLRQKDIEISNLRGAAVLNTNQPTLASATSAAAQSPTSSGPSISISQTRKRASEEEEENVICSATTSRATSALDLTAHASPMPADRMKELAALPEVAVDLDPTQVTPAIFTRQSLSSILGGSVQGLVVRCTESATQLARNRDIHDYLCPNMDHNAWSPAGPGKHGYMQVGLGRDRKLFNEGDYRHVFVGAGKHLVYCGWYHVFRVEPLTKEEWATLPPRVQLTYSETTLNKEKTREFRSVHQVLALYNSGELRAPCVRLQCVAFDTAFYQELVRANDQFFENKPRPVPPPVGAAGRSSAKRRRVAKVDEMAEDIEEGLGLAHAPASTKSVTQGSAPASSSIALPSSGSSATDTLTDGTAEASAAPRAPTLQDPSSSTIVPSPGGQTRRPTSAASNSIAIPSPGKQTRSSMRIQAAQSRSLMLRMRRKRGWDNTLQLTDSDEPASLWSSASEDDELYADE